MNFEKLVEKSLDVMKSIEKVTHETVALAHFVNDKHPHCELLSAIHGSSGLSFHFEVGFNIPIHTSAPGKAILAYLPKAEYLDVVSKMDFKRYTKSTITNKKDFYAELAEIRVNGYAIDVSEQIEGCHCLGVPIFDDNGYPIAGMWTTGVSGNLPVRDFAKFAKLFQDGSKDITAMMKSKGRNRDRKYINEVVEQAETIMRENTHKQLDMEKVAENLYVGYSWFRKAFKAKTGLSPNQYHMQCRIDKAKDFLENTEMPVKRIAEELGFESQHNFSALFKKKCGKSPNHFRNK